MTSTTRQNNLILNQDWKRIYQSFKNADFKSYDFENLRRVIIDYLRNNYAEDFNDYIESSEYMALVDAIAFLGQSLAFRIDLASRENFIELAETKQSVLRIAKMLSYNSKRNVAAHGLLKFTSVSTNEPLIDGNGKNLSNQFIQWNDPTNANWLEQFILILNTAMSPNTEFGRSQGSATIQGIPTEQYRFNTYSADVPIFNYSKIVAGRNMPFEIVSTAFKGQTSIYEEPPVPGNQMGFVYRNDGTGPASPNTGFFLQFKQGSLQYADFSISVPTINETISVAATNINNDDVWLYSLNSAGAQQVQWTPVSSLLGNNIVYNSISNNIRTIFSIVTKDSDSIDLTFADGVYGDLPQGSFRTYYRTSNGLSYFINPNDMKGINVSIPYINSQGIAYNLSIGLGLYSTVSSAAVSEDIDSIRTNAPASYYTQNRMITAEDYNLAPLTSSQNILKVKSVNRTSSGISRNFELIDPTGNYSDVTVFGDDGYIYKNEVERTLAFKFTNTNEIINFIRNHIQPTFSASDVYNFYLTKFDKILFTDTNTRWTQITSDVGLTTGNFYNEVDKSYLKVASYATSSLKYVLLNSLIRFVPPTGKSFKNGKIVTTDSSDPDQTSYIWANVVNVVGDGTNAGRGALLTGLGPVSLGVTVPSGAIAHQIVPKFVKTVNDSLTLEMINQLSQKFNFGLRYSPTTSTWSVITAANLNLIDEFNLGKAGDTTNNNLDSSWLLAFVQNADQYTVRIRAMDYIVGSIKQNRFYFDTDKKSFNSQTGKVIKDEIKILGINTGSDLITPLKNNEVFEVLDTIRYDDGFDATDKIKVAFADTNDDGVINNPESFIQIVGNDLTIAGDPVNLKYRYLFFKTSIDTYGSPIETLVDNADGSTVLIYQKQSLINVNDFNDGQLIYFYDASENRVMKVDRTLNTLVIQSNYRGNIGRSNLKFQYLHNASQDRRIDPSASNIMDVYILTRSYDTAFRNWLAGTTGTPPTVPTSSSLQNDFGTALDNIKSLSDEIIYHPVSYKILFGATAELKLQAQFNVVKNATRSINDNDLKVRIVNAINAFFDINNWDFGDTFYLSELTTYVLNTVSPDVSNIVIIPSQPTQAFGSLFEIQSASNEIFVSGATVDNISIVSAINAATIRANPSSIVNTTV